MRIAIATDAGEPQVSGVVATLKQTRDELEMQGYLVLMITPQGGRTIPCPAYPEVRRMLFGGRKIAQELDDELSTARRRAIKLNGGAPRRYAENRSWRKSTEQFVSHLPPRNAQECRSTEH